jgi:hypothetical protein
MLSAWAGSGETTWKRFVSKDDGYIAYYPSTWHRFPPLDSMGLNVYNFPFTRSGGGVLPADGASIAVVPSPPGTATVEQWHREDRRESLRFGTRGVISLRRASSGASLEVTEITLKVWEDGGYQMDGIECYFTLPGKLLSIRLQYWKGDPHAEEYRRVLHQMVERIRSIREPE